MKKFLLRLTNALDNRIASYLLLIKVSFFWHRENSKNHELPAPLIISLTSYPPRFKVLHLALRCLLSQSIKPDRIILWIAINDKSKLTKNILDLKKYGLEIKFCEDIKSYKKIIPTIVESSSSFIVTADDDVFYWRDWLKELVESYENDNDNIVIAHRAHIIKLDSNKNPLNYNSWEWDNLEKKTNISTLNFPTGCGGVLYPPYIFHKEVTNAEKFMSLCPTADDIWLYWMVRLKNGRIKKINTNKKLRFIPNSQINSLWKINVDTNNNDEQIKNMIESHPINFI